MIYKSPGRGIQSQIPVGHSDHILTHETLLEDHVKSQYNALNIVSRNDGQSARVAVDNEKTTIA